MDQLRALFLEISTVSFSYDVLLPVFFLLFLQCVVISRLSLKGQLLHALHLMLVFLCLLLYRESQKKLQTFNLM